MCLEILKRLGIGATTGVVSGALGAGLGAVVGVTGTAIMQVVDSDNHHSLSEITAASAVGNGPLFAAIGFATAATNVFGFYSSENARSSRVQKGVAVLAPFILISLLMAGSSLGHAMLESKLSVTLGTTVSDVAVGSAAITLPIFLFASLCACCLIYSFTPYLSRRDSLSLILNEESRLTARA